MICWVKIPLLLSEDSNIIMSRFHCHHFAQRASITPHGEDTKMWFWKICKRVYARVRSWIPGDYVSAKLGGVMRIKALNAKRIQNQGFSMKTCSDWLLLNKNRQTKVYRTIWSVLAEANKCKMPTCILSCYRNPCISWEMKSARLEFLCPAIGREIQRSGALSSRSVWRLEEKPF